MIHLIDDKRIRQNDNGWSVEKLGLFKDILTPIYSAEELTDLKKEELFIESNVILFHESFFDNPENKHTKDADKIRQDLIQFANKYKTILVFFSGSIGTRVINENIAYLPTNILYSNLETFLNYYLDAKINIDYLVYGDNIKREETLLIKQKIWNSLYDLTEVPKNNIDLKSELSKLDPNIDINKIDDLKTLKLLIKNI
jgi:hypothetical protein